MVHFAKTRYASLGAAMALSLSVAAVPAMAQTPAPPTRPPAERMPSERTPADKSAGMLEGSVKKVDPAAQTVQVSSGLLGMTGRTLEVTDRTQIDVDGRAGTLADIREGTKVKAAYETRNGKDVATRIEVVPTAAGSTPSDKTAPSERPTMGTTPGSPDRSGVTGSPATPPSSTR